MPSRFHAERGDRPPGHRSSTCRFCHYRSHRGSLGDPGGVSHCFATPAAKLSLVATRCCVLDRRRGLASPQAIERFFVPCIALHASPRISRGGPLRTTHRAKSRDDGVGHPWSLRSSAPIRLSLNTWPNLSGLDRRVTPSLLVAEYSWIVSAPDRLLGPKMRGASAAQRQGRPYASGWASTSSVTRPSFVQARECARRSRR